MKDILTGIRNTYLSDTRLSNAVNGMYFDTASEGVTMPYITYHLITNIPMWDFGVTTYEQPLIQFNIFSDKQYSASEICQVYSNLTILYDGATIAMDTHTQVMFQRGVSSLRRLGDEEVWIYSIDYSTIMEED